MLGLPDSVRRCLFDLAGVITQTAKVHGAAWKEMFDGYLREHAQQTGQPFVPFSTADYEAYPGSVRYLKAPRDAGLRRAVVSSSANCHDVLVGVAAGRAGGFGFVVGVDRVGQAEALKEHGADIVVSDLAELTEQQ